MYDIFQPKILLKRRLLQAYVLEPQQMLSKTLFKYWKYGFQEDIKKVRFQKGMLNHNFSQ